MDTHEIWDNAEEQLRDFLDNSEDLVEITSPDGRLLYANPTWMRAFGYGEDERPDVGSDAMVIPECADEYHAMRRRLLSGNVSETFEGIFSTHVERRLVLRVRGTPRMEGGVLRSIRYILRDVTAQRSAEDSRMRLIETLEATTDFVAVANGRGRAEYINRAGRRMIGIGDNDDVRGIGLSAIYTPEARQQAIDVALPAALRDGVWQGESVVLRRDGQEVPVSVVVVAHHSLRGGVWFVSTIMRDISAQKHRQAELQESEERFRRLSDASLDGIAVSRDGVMIEANNAWLQLFCFPKDIDLASIRPESLVVMADRERIVKYLIENQSVNYRCTCIRQDGTLFDAEVVGSPTTYRGKPARVTVVRDITEWRRLDRLKSEFVSTVSHELRTPLTSIRGSLGLLEGGAAGVLSSQGTELVRIARTNSERLIRLINDLLDLDKIEAGKLELRNTMLVPTDVVRVAVDGIRAMAEQFKVEVRERVTVHRTFRGDRDRVVQVLTNLLSNAIKFSPTGSMVELGVSETDNTRLRFAISNPGAGIAAADISRLFGRFQQLDSSDKRQRGGTGLGLAISKAIVEQHGREICVDSEPGVKTTFWFELPMPMVSATSRRTPGIVGSVTTA